MEVEAVNVDAGVVLMSNGEAVRITNFIDNMGHECDPELAVVVVSGPSSDGMWHTVDLQCFDAVKLN